MRRRCCLVGYMAYQVEHEAALELISRAIAIYRGRRSITTIWQCVFGDRHAWGSWTAQLKAVELDRMILRWGRFWRWRLPSKIRGLRHPVRAGAQGSSRRSGVWIHYGGALRDAAENDAIAALRGD